MFIQLKFHIIFQFQMNLSNNYSSNNAKLESNQKAAFKKVITTNNKQAVQKLLYSSTTKFSEAQLNQAIFLSIQNFKIDEQTDQILFLLLRNKANPNCEINNQTPLIASCKTEQCLLVKTLIENGAKVDHCNSLGQHPLKFVLKSRAQNYDIAQLIISQMNNVNMQIDGKPPIIITLQKQFHRIFKILVDKGSSLIFGEDTILHLIAKQKFKNMNKKKKMLKDLVGKVIVKKDQVGLFPHQCQTNQQLKHYILQHFKPKKFVEKQTLKQKMTNESFHSKQQKKKTQESFYEQNKKLIEKSKQKKQLGNDSFLSNKSNKKKHDQLSFQQTLQQECNNDDHIQTVQQQKQMEVNYEEEDKKQQCKEKTKNNSKTMQNTTNTIKKNKVDNKQNQTKYKKPSEVKKKFQHTDSNIKKHHYTQKKVDEIEEDKKYDENKKVTEKYKQKPLKSDKSDSKIQRKSLHRDQIKQKSFQIEQIKVPNSKPQKNVKNYTIIQQTKQEKHHQNVVDTKMLKLKQQFSSIIQKGLIQDDCSSEQSTGDNINRNIQAQLTQQIILLVERITKKTKPQRQTIQEIRKYFETLIKDTANIDSQKQNCVKVELYGSQQNNLSVEHSDIDLLVITPLRAEDLMYKLEKFAVFNVQHISDIKFLTTTSMPIIKMNYKEYKIDITFQIRMHTGLSCSKLVKQFINAQPLLRPLVLTFKTLLYEFCLCDTYTGGLGSYSLTLMTIALLQSTQTPKQVKNLGTLFLQFLYFYGHKMSYVCEAIIIHPPGFCQKPVYNIYQLPNTSNLTPKLIIYDPLNPVNNVGRPTYRINVIKKLLGIWYYKIVVFDAEFKDLFDIGIWELLNEHPF